MKSKNKKIPVFKNEDQERDFWAKNDLSDFIDQLKEVKLNFSKLNKSKNQKHK